MARNPNYELFTETKFSDEPTSRAIAFLRNKVYVGSRYVPDTFGAVRLVRKDTSTVRHDKLVVSYQVYSPFLRNNRYKGGDKFFHNASTNKSKILKLIDTRVRPPFAEERHLPEIEKVKEAQKKSLRKREYVSKQYADKVGNWEHRAKALAELVSLKKHLNEEPKNTYVFKSDSLSVLLDKYMQELAELGDAVDKKLEDSQCLQRVHIITGEKSGKSFFSRTVIRYAGSGTFPARHDVFGDTEDAAYAPIETMPEDVANQIAVLNMLDKPADLSGSAIEPTWVLNTGTMILSNELYYLPVDVDTLFIDT